MASAETEQDPMGLLSAVKPPASMTFPEFQRADLTVVNQGGGGGGSQETTRGKITGPREAHLGSKTCHLRWN